MWHFPQNCFLGGENQRLEGTDGFGCNKSPGIGDGDSSDGQALRKLRKQLHHLHQGIPKSYRKTFKHDHDGNLILLHLVESENLNQCDWMKWNRDLRILENWNQTLEMENSSSSEAFNLNTSSMCPLSLSFKVGNQGSKVLRYQGRKLTKDLICDFSSTFENRLPKILFLLCGFENITSEHYERKKESIALWKVKPLWNY